MSRQTPLAAHIAPRMMQWRPLPLLVVPAAQCVFRAQLCESFARTSSSAEYTFHTSFNVLQLASQVGGVKSGVAKKARLVSVRMIGCDGSTDTSVMATAIEWVIKDRLVSDMSCVVLLVYSSLSMRGMTFEPLLCAHCCASCRGCTSIH